MSKILVTGATGQLGTQVIDQLIQRVEAKNIYALVRNFSKAEGLRAAGVNIIKGNYDDYSSLSAAFKGIDKLYFISGSELDKRFIQHQNVVNAAIEAGVGHIFYTSAQRKTEDGSSPIASIADVHWQTDELIKCSGLQYTILKHGLYMNILPMFMGDKIIETGTIYLPAGDGRAAYVSRFDLAEAGAIALTTEGHAKKVYELSGNESISFNHIAGLISGLMGYQGSIEYISPTAEAYGAQLKKFGMSDETIHGITAFCEAIAQGEFDTVTNDLEALLGRKPELVRDFLKHAYKLDRKQLK